MTIGPIAVKPPDSGPAGRKSHLAISPISALPVRPTRFQLCKVTIPLVFTFDYHGSSCAVNSSRDINPHLLSRSAHRSPLSCTFAETISSQRLPSMQLLARHSSRNLLALVQPSFPRFHCGHIRREYLAPLARKIKPTDSLLQYLEFSSPQY